MPELIKPNRIADQFINKAFMSVDLPHSNDQEKMRDFSDFLIANHMAKIGTAKKNAATKDFKANYTARILSLDEGFETEIDSLGPFTLLCKKQTPRSTFDKEAFIKAVSDKFDLSMSELNSLSKTCTKKSASPLSFTINYSE